MRSSTIPFRFVSWNHFDDALDSGRCFRTNNNLKGRHRPLFKVMRPAFWEFLQKMKKLHQAQLRELNRVEIEEEALERLGCLAVDDCITNLARNFSNRVIETKSVAVRSVG